MDEPWPIEKLTKVWILFAACKGADRLVMAVVESCESYRLWDLWLQVDDMSEELVPPSCEQAEEVPKVLARMEQEYAPWPKCKLPIPHCPSGGRFEFPVGSGVARISYAVAWKEGLPIEINVAISGDETLAQAARLELDEIFYDPLRGIVN
jgi:hypothetical protein